MALKIITVLRSSPEYNAEKVKAVQAMCAKHITIPYEFICLSDIDIEGVKVEKLKYSWPGWYAKMEMYQIEGPCLYLDLDTSIIGNIDAILKKAMKKEFVILRDFYRGAKNPRAMGSGLMFWSGDLSFIYELYRPNPIKIPGGDQIILEKIFNHEKSPYKVTFWQDFTDGVCSYKVHIRDKGDIVEPHQKIVCFHGKPRPWNQTVVPYFPAV